MDDYMERESEREARIYQMIIDDVARYLSTHDFIPVCVYTDVLMDHCDAANYGWFRTPLVMDKIIKLAMEVNSYDRFKKEDCSGVDLAVSETRDQKD